MKVLLIIVNLLFLTILVNAQITIGNNTLPNVGDVLQYTNFVNFGDTSTYKLKGEDLTWNYDNFEFGGTSETAFEEIEGTTLQEEFPEANMIVSLFGFNAAAIRTENNVEILGVDVSNFGGFEVEIDNALEEPFLYIKTPFNYTEKFQDDFRIRGQIGADQIPQLDSLDFELPIPGATLDSIRLTFEYDKSEEADAWGTLNVLGNNYEVLKVEEVVTTEIKIEVGLSVFGFLTWIDASPFLGGDSDFFGENQNTTYKFISAEEKYSIIEFNENRTVDSLGIETLMVTGRVGAELLSEISEEVTAQEISISPNPTNNLINIEASFFDIEKVQLFNNNGSLIENFNPELLDRGIDCSRLESGVYYIRLVVDGANIVRRFVRM